MDLAFLLEGVMGPKKWKTAFNLIRIPRLARKIAGSLSHWLPAMSGGRWWLLPGPADRQPVSTVVFLRGMASSRGHCGRERKTVRFEKPLGIVL
jgi:hypothetical protein